MLYLKPSATENDDSPGSYRSPALAAVKATEDVFNQQKLIGLRSHYTTQTMSAQQDSRTDKTLAFDGGEDVHETRTMAQLKEDAQAATSKEKAMTLREGLRLYPKAIGWSMLISSCIIMEGYDGAC